MAEKALQQKFQNCRQLIIQNMQKGLQHKMVYMFLKDRKKTEDIKQLAVNGKDGIIKIQFFQHEKAVEFYDELNFNDKILLRKLNIYFSMSLSENQMKKCFLEGITQENQRQIFEIIRKIGIFKLYTSYQNGPQPKLKSAGLLSFVKADPINDADFNALTERLLQIGVKISKQKIKEVRKPSHQNIVQSPIKYQEEKMHKQPRQQDNEPTNAKLIIQAQIKSIESQINYHERMINELKEMKKKEQILLRYTIMKQVEQIEESQLKPKPKKYVEKQKQKQFPKLGQL